MAIPNGLIRLAAGLALAAQVTGQLPRAIHAVHLAQVKLVGEIRSTDWGCPSIFNKTACKSYDS